jgi:hypothetical protein
VNNQRDEATPLIREEPPNRPRSADQGKPGGVSPGGNARRGATANADMRQPLTLGAVRLQPVGQLPWAAQGYAMAASDLVRRDAQAFPYDPAHEAGREEPVVAAEHEVRLAGAELAMHEPRLRPAAGDRLPDHGQVLVEVAP